MTSADRLVRCGNCGQARKAIVYWPVGPVCRSCYVRARARPAPCQACGLVRVLIAESPAAAGDQVQLVVCGPCSGSRHSYLCTTCGGGDEPYKNGVCVRCAVQEKLTAAFTGSGGELSDQAARVIEAMTCSRRPRSVLQWWSNPSGGAQILRETFGRGDEVTHELLDSFGDQTAWSLRRTLIDLDVLPERDETLAKLQSRIRRIAAAAPRQHRHLLLTYGNWWVLRGAQRHHQRAGRFTKGQVRSAERRLICASDFLTWLDQQDLALEDLTQPDVERWSEAYPLAREAADFLRWAHRRRLTGQVTVPYRPRTDPDIILSEDDRWRLLTKCLHDTGLPTDLRVAGSLLLLYGLPLTRIVELTLGHLDPPETRTSSGLRIAADSPAIVIPPALGRLLAQLPATPRNPSAVALIESAGKPAWLFPGRSAHGNVNASVISKRLKEQGIHTRASRNAALIALAADLPASVLSELFGISITSALQWTRRASRDWNTYVAATINDRRTRSAPPV